MRKSRFADAQVISILKETAAGLRAKDVARKYGVSEHTIYRWKAKLGGMEVSEEAQLQPSIKPTPPEPIGLA